MEVRFTEHFEGEMENPIPPPDSTGNWCPISVHERMQSAKGPAACDGYSIGYMTKVYTIFWKREVE